MSCTKTYELAVNANEFILTVKEGTKTVKETRLLRNIAKFYVHYEKELIHIDSLDQRHNRDSISLHGDITYTGLNSYENAGDTSSVNLDCGLTVTPTQNFADLVLFVTEVFNTNKLTSPSSLDFALLTNAETPVAQAWTIIVPDWADKLAVSAVSIAVGTAGTGDTLDVTLSHTGGNAIAVASIADGETTDVQTTITEAEKYLTAGERLTIAVTNAPGNTERGLSVAIDLSW